MSLFESVYQDGGDTIYLIDQVKDDRVSEDEWVRDLSIRQALDHLAPRERKIIRRRFFQGRTQMEVAEEIGISQAQVSRLEKAALQRMRKYVSAKVTRLPRFAEGASLRVRSYPNYFRFSTWYSGFSAATQAASCSS